MNEPIRVPMPGVALPILMKQGGKKEYGLSELGELIELQGTGEGRSFTLTEQQDLVRLCAKGCKELLAVQRQILGSI